MNNKYSIVDLNYSYKNFMTCYLFRDKTEWIIEYCKDRYLDAMVYKYDEYSNGLTYNTIMMALIEGNYE